MAQFSFDIKSDYDKAEINNVLDQTKREIANRYDFKNTAAGVEFGSEDKDSIKITGESQYQLDAIMEILRKKAASRNISQKVFDTSLQPESSNMKMSWLVPLRSGLDKEKTKQINKLIRQSLPKVKTQIMGDEIRVTSPKKDELQAAMQLLRESDFDFPIIFVNFR